MLNSMNAINIMLNYIIQSRMLCGFNIPGTKVSNVDVNG